MLNVNRLALFLILVGSTFQYGDVIVSRYFVPMLSICICWFFLILSKVKLSDTELSIFLMHFLFFILFSFLSFIGNGDFSEFYFDIVKLFLAFSMSFLAYFFILYNSTEVVEKYLLLMLYSAVFLLGFELYGRLLLFQGDLDLFLSNFYLLKVESPFMVDSNAVGLYALFYFVVALYLLRLKSFNYKVQTFMLSFVFLVFIFTTLSRAAVVAAVFLIGLLFWIKLPKVLKYVLIPLIIGALGYFLYAAVGIMDADSSGSTKLDVLRRITDIAPLLDIKGFLFGYGINEGNYIYSYEEGKYSHLLFPMVMGHFGLIGLLLYILYFYICLYLSKGYSFLLVIATFLVGLSYLHPFLESIFLANGVLLGVFYSRKNNQHINAI